ncbi:hypothetical protein Tco_0111644 [Tanacetum coccineum]
MRMTMHEVVHELVLGECHDPNSKGLSSAWKAYMNARVPGLFMLVLLEYPNGKGVVCVTSRGIDMALHWSEYGFLAVRFLVRGSGSPQVKGEVSCLKTRFRVPSL